MHYATPVLYCVRIALKAYQARIIGLDRCISSLLGPLAAAAQ